MLGWEFPPYNSGGLGVACEGMARSFVKRGMDVTFVMPKAPKNAKSDFLNLLVADNLEYDVDVSQQSVPFEVKAVDSLITAYSNESSYRETYKQYESVTLSLKSKIYQNDAADNSFDLNNQYGSDLYSEVWRYSQKVGAIAKETQFDVIHAHDWHTYQAGIEAKKVSGKPLIVHIHNTSFDRSGGNPNPQEYNIEYEGFHGSDKVIAISQFVKNTLITHYGVPSEKVEVVHNGIDVDAYTYQDYKSQIKEKDKVVLFAGRVTLQKGPDYFIKAAHKVVQKNKNVKFILAGNGDMLNKSVELAAELGLSNHFIFSGRYTKEEGVKLMNMADVFVMPSVSEPFGLVPLEAMIQKTPTIISKQSGVAEVLANTLRVDFWDVDALANKIHSVINYGALHEQLSEYGATEVKNLTWDPNAEKCHGIFSSLVNM